MSKFKLGTVKKKFMKCYKIILIYLVLLEWYAKKLNFNMKMQTCGILFLSFTLSKKDAALFLTLILFASQQISGKKY